MGDFGEGESHLYTPLFPLLHLLISRARSGEVRVYVDPWFPNAQLGPVHLMSHRRWWSSSERQRRGLAFEGGLCGMLFLRALVCGSLGRECYVARLERRQVQRIVSSLARRAARVRLSTAPIRLQQFHCPPRLACHTDWDHQHSVQYLPAAVRHGSPRRRVRVLCLVHRPSMQYMAGTSTCQVLGLCRLGM
jgi:hypothetical protein